MGLWPGLIISGYYGAPARRRPIGGIFDGMEMGGGRSLAPLHDGPDHHRGDRTEFERTVASNSTDGGGTNPEVLLRARYPKFLLAGALCVRSR